MVELNFIYIATIDKQILPERNVILYYLSKKYDFVPIFFSIFDDSSSDIVVELCGKTFINLLIQFLFIKSPSWKLTHLYWYVLYKSLGTMLSLIYFFQVALSVYHICIIQRKKTDTNYHNYTTTKYFFARWFHCEVHISVDMICCRKIIFLVIIQPNNIIHNPCHHKQNYSHNLQFKLRGQCYKKLKSL